MRIHDWRGLGGVYERRGEFAGLVDSQLDGTGRLEGRKWEIETGGMSRTALLRKDLWAAVRGFLGLASRGEEFGESLGAVESFLLEVDRYRNREVREGWKRGGWERRCREHLHSDMKLMVCS